MNDERWPLNERQQEEYRRLTDTSQPVPRSSKKVSPTEIRLAVEWLARNANGVSLIDWEPRSHTLLNAADEVDRLRANAQQAVRILAAIEFDGQACEAIKAVTQLLEGATYETPDLRRLLGESIEILRDLGDHANADAFEAAMGEATSSETNAVPEERDIQTQQEESYGASKEFGWSQETCDVICPATSPPVPHRFARGNSPRCDENCTHTSSEQQP